MKKEKVEKRVLAKLAERAWTQAGNKIWCVVPSEYQEYIQARTIDGSLYDIFCATHYTLNWKIEGKVVAIKLYCADDLGATAVNESMLVKQVDISLNRGTPFILGYLKNIINKVLVFISGIHI